MSDIRWVRSMPDPMPEHRAYVHDDLPKFFHTDYNYTKLVPQNDGVRLNLIEWDVAIGQPDYEAFGMWFTDDDVWAVPVLHTDLPSGSIYYPQRVYEGNLLHWIKSELREVDASGFDLISFPPGYLRQCYEWLLSLAPREDQRLTDSTFSRWMREVKHQKICLDWTVHAVHLHYSLT